MTKEPASPADARRSGDTAPGPDVGARQSHTPETGWLPLYFTFLAGAPIGPWRIRLSLPPERELRNDPGRERLPVAQRSSAQHEAPGRIE